MDKTWTLICCLLAASLAHAGPGARVHEQGWFYYEPLPQPKPPTPLKPPVAVPGGRVTTTVPLGSAWLRKNLPLYLDRAMDQPTLANVRRYRYLERLAMDRSSAYSDASARLTMLDPLLDEQSVSPITALAKATRHREQSARQQQVLGQVARDAGLWFFFRSDCPYCHAQTNALQTLSRLYGFSILPISLDHRPLPSGAFSEFVPDQGQAAKLNVSVTPSLFLVHRDGRVLPLASGLQTQDQLVDRILELGHTLGWIAAADYDALRALQNTALDDLAAGLGPAEDPDQLIDALIEQGADRIGRGTPISPITKETP
ncbi:hypothetical protein C7S18_19110 [Ahniella affigens]|uniref:Conjugal transfer protein TraF n=1 Tax=Ahniella affigens TaxID=2021234 RepID=A0A2P1PWC1_9GAMM|nr:conjugal transfer protein TraF [Ahniella affigens]AVP99147.1 hypothetical protein C7S18_19110 [Ahniella affigens]